MQEIRKRARERMKPWCRVCPVCDGKACAGEVPGMGGIGTGVSFRNNVTALASYRLNMRVLHEANDTDTRLDLWGRNFPLPVFASPFGGMAANLGGTMTDTAYTGHVVKGCAASGTLAGIGDLPNIDDYAQYMSGFKSHGSFVVPYIKPWPSDMVARRMTIARDIGCEICGMDVDAAGLPAMRRLATPVSVKSGPELAAIVALAHERGMKFIVKGVMTADEAVVAADAGADAVIVSNHGGRVLDHTPGAAEVLPAIAEAAGRRIVVMVDGGIRTGADVLKILALGAQAALVCRPLSVMIHGDEENGVPKYFETLRDQLSQVMRLTGCKDLGAITSRVIW